MKITPARFVQTWRSAKCLEDVCVKLGIRPNVASARASYYRKRGIEMQKMESSRTLSVDELNAARTP